jgi:hypothetical protein
MLGPTYASSLAINGLPIKFPKAADFEKKIKDDLESVKK